MIKGWTSTKHEYGQSHAKGILQRLSAERAGELLNLSRNQPEIRIGLPTEHCNLNEHPQLVGSPGHYRCKEAFDTASQILYNCEVFVVLRFRHVGHHFFVQTSPSARHSTIFRVQGCWSAHPHEFYSILLCLCTWNFKPARSVHTQKFIFQYIPFHLLKNFSETKTN